MKKDQTRITERSYRQLVRSGLMSMRVAVQETDLSVCADGLTVDEVKDLVIEQRGYLEHYIQRFPEFAQTLVPWPDDELAPPLVQDMIQAGQKASVGPMASVAGALAEHVGRALLRKTDEVIIENGGDIFMKADHPLSVAVFAGHSPLSLKIGLRIDPGPAPLAVCTSSGSVGHSLSKGRADAVCVLSGSCALADAAATAIGNRVRDRRQIEAAVQWGRAISGVDGILIIIGDKMGMWGRIRLTALDGKKG
jgi:uncharacterized protein